jgi:hypothetical protein
MLVVGCSCSVVVVIVIGIGIGIGIGIVNGADVLNYSTRTGRA